jgi:hypothetical protein
MHAVVMGAGGAMVNRCSDVMTAMRVVAGMGGGAGWGEECGGCEQCTETKELIIAEPHGNPVAVT